MGLVTTALFVAASETIFHAFQTLQVSTESIGPDNHGIEEVLQGKPVERELSGSITHSYRVTLAAGQYARLVIDKGSLSVLVTLVGQDGQRIHEFTSRRYGPIQVSWVARSTGICRLDLSLLEANAGAGRYQLRIEALRTATSRDAISIAAERSFREAERLRFEWTGESLQKAIKKYNDAFLSWRAAGDQREEAQALSAIGEAYSSLSEYLRALGYHKQALLVSQTAKDRRGEVQALNDIGYVLAYLGENQRALTTCEQALQLSRATNLRFGEGQALNNLGEIYYAFGDVRKALSFFDQALSLWRTLDVRQGQAQTLISMGYAYFDQGDIQKALIHYNQSLSLAREVHNRRGEALAYTAMGGVYSSVGERQKAFDSHNQALDLFRTLGDRTSEAATLNGIGQAYEDLANFEAALHFYGLALQLSRAVGDRRSEGISHIYIGRAHESLGNNSKAIEHYKSVLPIARATGDERLQAHVLSFIGIAYGTLGRSEEALDHHTRALQIYRAVEDWRGEARCLNAIGHVHDLSGEKKTALIYYKQALPLSNAAQDRGAQAFTLYNIARMERDLGNLGEARSQIEAALEITESLRTKVASQDLRASYFASVRQQYDLYIDLLMRMHQQHPSEGLDAAALQASERGRARSLLESLTEARTDIRQGIDPTLLERERSLQQLLNAKADRQMRLLSGKPESGRIGRSSQRDQRPDNRVREVQGQIRSKSPRYAALMQPQPLALQEIQQQVLDDETLLLEYALGDERSYLWAVTPDGHHQP